MVEGKEMKRSESGNLQEKSEEERAIRPPVDIHEDEQGITLYADMPGVSKDRLDIKIDRDSLSIEGRAVISTPENMEALYADVQTTRYRRSFTLGGELDSEKADAALKDGVLTLRIPKREQYQPRKIEVRME
ncbi:MAG: Hsp20/alpha crystallin family protein [Candidatus Thiodiazotropha endolucinida]